MSSKKLEFIAPTWDHIEFLTVSLYKLVKDSFSPDIIAGISRGGLVPARIVSDLYLVEFEKPTLAIMQIGFYSGVGKTEKEPIIYQDLPGHIHGKKILLIDDVADSGISLEFAMKYLSMKKPLEVKIGTLYLKPWSIVTPHYYIEETDKWIIFPHERYEFMSEQLKERKMGIREAKKFFLEEAGIPEYSVNQFIEVIKQNTQG
ncbi:MAG: phosphoribosyltransferase [Candidatus Heimdallarchaeota archaeon]|nr:MAG: phosphoribosyltransferase [Candidatus Heimdallarchaeota archaeon]